MILTYFNFNITSIVNVLMLSIEKKIHILNRQRKILAIEIAIEIETAILAPLEVSLLYRRILKSFLS